MCLTDWTISRLGKYIKGSLLPNCTYSLLWNVTSLQFSALLLTIKL
jgi:hypothetical protein